MFMTGSKLQGFGIRRARVAKVVAVHLATAFALGLSAQTSAAQEREGVDIDRIARTLSEGKSQKVKEPTASVRIQRQDSLGWTDAAPGTALGWHDRLRVQRNFHVKVDVDRSSQRGRLTFAPEPVQKNAQPVYLTVAGTPTVDALYEVVSVSDSARASDLALRVYRGAVTVVWLQGSLTIHAAGDSIIVGDSKLVVWVDPSGDEALVFLESGQVSLPGHEETVSAGDEVRLRRGEPPEVEAVAPGVAASYQSAIQYNAVDLWRTSPFWRNPVLLVPVGAALAAGVTAGLISSGEDQKTVAGTITIRIPF